jgi:Icc-related predicted phosphoesterase
MPPWLSTMYYLTEEEIAAALQQGRMQVGEPRWEVVISHPPPRRTKLDVIANGEHVGSTALRDFIETAQPHLVICGHIHESRGIDHIGDTTLVNCGAACRGYYAVVDIDESIEVSLKSVPLSRSGQ